MDKETLRKFKLKLALTTGLFAATTVPGLAQNNISQDDTRTTTENVNSNFTERETPDGKITYICREDGSVSISGKGLNINPYLLTPKVEKLPNGNYKCGSCIAPDRNVINSENNLLRSLITQHLVYRDLLRIQAEGGTLNPTEKSFLDVHPQNLAREGISINKKGYLVQKNPENKITKSSRDMAQLY
ncbi:MAG: hypothetical protein IJ525_05940 [Alphaproteobacteria bacterium]|nr:hypothetical protein [Alphaproteobacteria bacterium]